MKPAPSPRSVAGTPAADVSVPTPATRAWRTSIPFQALRFALINIKILRMLARAHAAARHPPR